MSDEKYEVTCSVAVLLPEQPESNAINPMAVNPTFINRFIHCFIGHLRFLMIPQPLHR